MSNDERQCDPDRKDWTDCQPSSAVLQNSRYFAASGAQDWAEQNEDIAEKGEGISDDIPVMGRNYTVSMTNKNELFNERKVSFGWSQNVKGGRHASDRFQHSVTDEIRSNTYDFCQDENEYRNSHQQFIIILCIWNMFLYRKFIYTSKPGVPYVV